MRELLENKIFQGVVGAVSGSLGGLGFLLMFSWVQTPGEQITSAAIVGIALLIAGLAGVLWLLTKTVE